MQETVLFVDDDSAVLGYAASLFVGKGVRVLTSTSAAEALRIVGTQGVAVLVTDNCMPGMSGLELLTEVSRLSPDTVKIMMTAYADLATALSAINKSEVFRFVVKPWKKWEMLQTVKDGMRRFRILQSIRREDEYVLHSLAQTIELKDPLTRGHCDRVANYAVMLAADLGLSGETLTEIKYGSWLHDCGKIGIPEAILNVRRGLTPEEFQVVRKHPVWGLEVVRKAHLSMVVQNIVLCHHERYDGNGYPAGLQGEDIPLEARIVSVVDIYDALLTDRPYRKGYSREDTVAMLVDMKRTFLDPDLVDLFLRKLASAH